MSVLRQSASLLIWGTLPATFSVAVGFGLQVLRIIPSRHRLPLVGLVLLLGATAAIATVLSDPEILNLGSTPIRVGTVADLLLRLSLNRMLEAPAYVGLGLLYLLAHWEIGVHGLTPTAAGPAADPGKG